MKRNIVTLKTLGLMVALSLAAGAAAPVQFGLGVGLLTSGGEESTPTVSAPIRFGNFRVEPAVSYYSNDGETKYNYTPPNNLSDNTYEDSYYSFEVGAYWLKQIAPSTELSLGGRVGYSWYDSTSEYPNVPNSEGAYESSGFYLGPTVGGEYFFNPHVSVGADVSLLFASNSATSENSSYDSEGENDAMSLQSGARLRFYM